MRVYRPWSALQRFLPVFGIFLVLISPATLFGQGCAICYTTAAAAKDVTARALRRGILILAVPPVVLFGAIVGMALRRSGDIPPKKLN